MRNVLIDAGPLIALFAIDDAHHARYDRFVTESAVSDLRLVTTWPCVIEASYILDAPLRFELCERLRALPAARRRSAGIALTDDETNDPAAKLAEH